VTFEDTHFSLGWSHGKEKFKGKPDYAKGSFYANAQAEDRIPKYDDDVPDDRNVFPDEIPELKPAFKNLGQLICDVGYELAHHIDSYVSSKVPSYEKGKLSRILKEANNVIGRLLHYFPVDKASEEDPLCGLHNDHGSLTGLCGAMYLDKDGKLVDFVDEEAGLHIIGRDGLDYRAKIPKDCLAFQIGETLQVHTGGFMVATPHLVKSGQKIAGTGISRNTLAVFMEPRMKEPQNAPEGISREQTIGKVFEGLPLLEKRWKDGQVFHDFHEATIKEFEN